MFSSKICYLKYGLSNFASEACISSSLTTFLKSSRGFHTTTIVEAKSKKKKINNKTKMFIRPADVIEFVDLEEVNQKMELIVKDLKTQFAQQIRLSNDVTLFEQIKLSIDGEEYFLNEITEINQLNPRLVAIDLVDYPEYVENVDKALREQNLGFNPIIDGTEIKVPLPQATIEQANTRIKQAQNLMKKANRSLDEAKDDTMKLVNKISNAPKDTKYFINEQLKAYVESHVASIQKAFDAKRKSLKV